MSHVRCYENDFSAFEFTRIIIREADLKENRKICLRLERGSCYKMSSNTSTERSQMWLRLKIAVSKMETSGARRQSVSDVFRHHASLVEQNRLNQSLFTDVLVELYTSRRRLLLNNANHALRMCDNPFSIVYINSPCSLDAISFFKGKVYLLFREPFDYFNS